MAAASIRKAVGSSLRARSLTLANEKLAPTAARLNMKLAVLAMLSRVLVFAVAIAARNTLPMRPCTQCWDIGVPFVNLFSRWDSAYYANIAMLGYPHQITARWAFFPGYPILIGMLGRFLTITVQLKLVPAVYLAGFLVSNLAFFGAVFYLSRLSTMILNNRRLAFISAALLAFYPAGVFLSAVCSDSLFLLLTISSLYYCWRDNLGRSAALGFLASLTRPVGVLLVAPIAYKLLQDSSRRNASRSYLPAVGIMLGFLSFVAYSQLMTGTMFASSIAERSFWLVYFNPYDRFMEDLHEILVNPIILPYLVLSLSAIVAYIQRVRNRDETAIGLYAICLLAAYLISPLDSFARYSITLLPMYWSFSRWAGHSAARVLIYALFLVLLAIGTALFVNWYRFY